VDLAGGDHGGHAAVEETVDPAELALARCPVAEDGVDVAVDQAGGEGAAFGVDADGGLAGVAVGGAADGGDAAGFGDHGVGVAERGGEVLKFIGDAMLAIFPTGVEAAQTCGAALFAARRAQAALIVENRRRESEGLPRIDYGLALHVGDVMYGNIGSDTRLDFTVIGPAVNLTARIESMCAQLGRPLLLSSDFVRAAGISALPLGAFQLKGIGAEQRIFAPAPAD